MTIDAPKKALLPFAFLISMLPILAALAPRGLAYSVPVIGLIGYVSLYLQTKTWPRISQTVATFMAGMSFLAAICVLWGYDSEAITTDKAIKLAPILLGLTLLIACTRNNQRTLSQLLSVSLPISCLFAMIFLLIDFYGDNLIYRTIRGGEITYKPGNFSHLNRSVISVTVLSLISLGLLYQNSFKSRNLLAGALVIGLGIIAANTHSQSMQLSLIVAALSALILPYGVRWGWGGLSLIIAAFLLSTPFLAQMLYHSVAEQATNYKFLTEGYAAARMEIWDFISRRALEQPWLGHGIEATRSITDFDVPHVYQIENTILHPHNFAIQIWIEFGLLGALWFSAFFALAMRGIWQGNIQMRRLQTTILTTILTMAAISYGMWQGWWVGTIGLAFALAQLFNRADA